MAESRSFLAWPPMRYGEFLSIMRGPGREKHVEDLCIKQMPQVRELGFAASRFLIEPRVRVRGRLVRGILPLVAAKIDARVPRIVGRFGRRVATAKTLLTRPGVEQGAIDREVIIGQQPRCLRSTMRERGCESNAEASTSRCQLRTSMSQAIPGTSTRWISTARCRRWNSSIRVRLRWLSCDTSPA
jgi:hypothetical protein